MKSDIVLSSKCDIWCTPKQVFADLDAEFHFNLDAAATRANALCPIWLGPDQPKPYDDALLCAWPCPSAVFLNPPYSLNRRFMEKADHERHRGSTVVCLVPSRTDTRWWHAHVWDVTKHMPRPGVEIRFFKGRLKFDDQPQSAPFPSCVLIFRPVPPSEWQLERERDRPR